MLKNLNDLLCLQFKLHKRVLDYGKIEWQCDVKSFLSLSHITLLLPYYINDFKVFARFSEIGSLFPYFSIYLRDDIYF